LRKRSSKKEKRRRLQRKALKRKLPAKGQRPKNRKQIKDSAGWGACPATQLRLRWSRFSSLLSIMGLEIKNCVLPKQLSLIVGLGNPGGAYDKTRHNAGFMAADKLAATFGVAFEKQKFDVVYGRGLVESARVILAKPMAFMNLSGPPIKKLANFYKIPSEDILVVHDDIDLAFGRRS
jgi:hypothetical protein